MSEVEWLKAAGARECDHDCGCAIKVGDWVAFVDGNDAFPCLACGEKFEKVAGWITMDWNWYRATRRRYRIRTVLALAVGVALGAPLGRWSR